MDISYVVGCVSVDVGRGVSYEVQVERPDRGCCPQFVYTYTKWAEYTEVVEGFSASRIMGSMFRRNELQGNSRDLPKLGYDFLSRLSTEALSSSNDDKLSGRLG